MALWSGKSTKLGWSFPQSSPSVWAVSPLFYYIDLGGGPPLIWVGVFSQVVCQKMCRLMMTIVKVDHDLPLPNSTWCWHSTHHQKSPPGSILNSTTVTGAENCLGFQNFQSKISTDLNTGNTSNDLRVWDGVFSPQSDSKRMFSKFFLNRNSPNWRRDTPEKARYLPKTTVATALKNYWLSNTLDIQLSWELMESEPWIWVEPKSYKIISEDHSRIGVIERSGPQSCRLQNIHIDKYMHSNKSKYFHFGETWHRGILQRILLSKCCALYCVERWKRNESIVSQISSQTILKMTKTVLGQEIQKLPSSSAGIELGWGALPGMQVKLPAPMTRKVALQ